MTWQNGDGQKDRGDDVGAASESEAKAFEKKRVGRGGTAMGRTVGLPFGGSAPVHADEQARSRYRKTKSVRLTGVKGGAKTGGNAGDGRGSSGAKGKKKASKAGAKGSSKGGAKKGGSRGATGRRGGATRTVRPQKAKSGSHTRRKRATKKAQRR